MTTVKLIADGDDLILPIPDEMLEHLDLEVGDTVVWKDNKDGSFSITKRLDRVPSVIVLVETVKITKSSYFVSCPATNPEYALDSVVCEEVEPMLTEYLDEVVVGHRMVSDTEYKRLIGDCDEQ